MWNILKPAPAVSASPPPLSKHDERLLNAAREILKSTFGYDNFRGGQETVMLSLLNGRDTLAIMPTGGGKSLCYQVPALMLPGITLVVSPLIALMKDQVDSLRKLGYPAAVINSQSGIHDVQRVYLDLSQSRLKLLFISPERFGSDSFVQQMLRFPISLVAVDEAHCISEWGYDFRPSYQKIADGISKCIPPERLRPATLALTATATDEVLGDIKTHLRLQTPVFFTGGFERDNLSLSVFKVENKRGRLLEILKGVGGAAVVYAQSRKAVEETALLLKKSGISAAFYHAGLGDAARSDIQEKFFSNHYRVICATNAFGMGINKSDVRTVVHLDLPETLEAYYQEAGRAGRDGIKSFAVMLYAAADIERRRYMIENAYPSPKEIQTVYSALASMARDNPYSQVIIEREALRGQISKALGKDFSSVKFGAAIGVLERYKLSAPLYDEAENESLKLLVSREELEQRLREEGNPSHLKVFEQVLRSFGTACFSEAQSFSLAAFSAKASVKSEEVMRVFQQWAWSGVAEFRSASMLALSMPLHALAPESIPVDWKFLERRKKLSLQKFEQVLRYMTHAACRRNFILDYFGEARYTERCGVCDICTGRHRR